MRQVASLALAVAVSCVGHNDREAPERPLDFPALGKTHVDPVSPGTLHLTFDDGPGPYTRDIVDTLNRHRVLATFFCVGRNIPGFRDVLSYVRASGHQLANHSYFHEVQPALPEEVFKYRVSAVQRNLEGLDDGRLYFRFPYGAASEETLRWLSEIDFDGRTFVAVGWNADSQDFNFQPTADDPVPHADIVNEVEKACDGQDAPFTHDFLGYSQFVARRVGGGIMLFHDIQRLTRDNLDEVLNAFERPERYWTSLPPDRAAEYRRYYACRGAPTDTVFRFASIQSGYWPTLVR